MNCRLGSTLPHSDSDRCARPCWYSCMALWKDLVYYFHTFDLIKMCGTVSIRTYGLTLTVGCDSELYMFPVSIVRFLNLLHTYLATCSIALLATIKQ